MKISECNKCTKNIQNKNYSKGTKPANVMVIFDFYPTALDKEALMLGFIDNINKLVGKDLYYGYAIKCSTTVNSDSIKNCRSWMNLEISQVQPYLIILMGIIPKLMVFGNKYKGLLKPNMFYVVNEPKKAQYFLGNSVNRDGIGDISLNTQYLNTFIKEYYV